MRTIPVAMAVALLLAACGGGQPAEEAAAGGASPGATSGGAARSGGEESVAAVQQSPGTPLATLRFNLTQRPVVGQPFPLQLVLQSKTPVPELRVEVESGELAVSPEVATLALEADQPLTHELMLSGREADLLEVRVRLAAGEGGAATVYAIPVLVSAAAAGE